MTKEQTERSIMSFAAPPSASCGEEDALTESSQSTRVTESSFNDAEVTSLVQSVVSWASLTKREDRLLEYHLPLLQPSTLAHLFSQLEEKKDSLGVVSYSMNSPTMEEVSVSLAMNFPVSTRAEEKNKYWNVVVV